MKKILLLSVLMLYPGMLWAKGQAEPGQIKLSDEMTSAELDEEFFSFLDMKLLHDREIVQNVITQLYNQQMVEGDQEEPVAQGILSEEDTTRFNDAINNNKVAYTLTPELMEKVEKKPFEAFKDFVKTSTIRKVTTEEMSELEKVDKKAVSRTLQMLTESGPEIGAKQVAVIYDNEVQD